VLSQFPIGGIVVSVVTRLVVNVAAALLLAKNFLDVVWNLPLVVRNALDDVGVVLELSGSSPVVLDMMGLA
jgi:hypothetical protein